MGGRSHRRTIGRRAGHARFAALVVLLALLPSGTARAQELLSGFVELIASTRETRNEDRVTGDVDDISFDTLQTRISLVYDQRWSPAVSFRAGVLVDEARTDREILDVRSEDKSRRILPFARLLHETATTNSQLVFQRQRQISEFADVRTETIRDDYRAIVDWKPDKGYPQSRVELRREETYDPDRSLLDQTSNRALLATRWFWRDAFDVRYFGTVNDTENDVVDSEVRTQTHSLRLGYRDEFWEDRVVFRSTYTGNYVSTESRVGSDSDFLVPLFPLQGLASIDDTPDFDPLVPNDALIDRDRATGVGINLGLPPPAGDDRPRNVGLDFGSVQSVDTLLVWIDRDLPQEVSDVFRWEVFASDDNLNWIRFGSAAGAPFGPFERRFEIRVPRRATRYVKVVVEPLAASDPRANEFPVIEVTEIEAGTTQTGTAVRSSADRTAHVLDTNARTRILKDGSLLYDLNLFGTKSDGMSAAYTVSNALTYSRLLHPKLGFSARAARLDGREERRDTVGYNYAASLSANPVPKLRHSLVVGGTRNDNGRTVVDNASAVLTSVAEIYRNVDVRLILSRTASNNSDFGVTRGTEIRLGSTIVPHPTFVFNLAYADRRTDVPEGRLDASRKIGEASIAYRPFSQLYVYAARQIVDDANLPRDTLDRISVSWNPFSGGTLQLSLAYNEQTREATGRKESTFFPSASWRIRSGTYLIVSYQDVSIRSDLQTLDTEITTATLRATF